jgi:hypothetical protein
MSKKILGGTMLARYITVLFVAALLAGGFGTSLTVMAKSRKAATPKLVQGFSNPSSIAINGFSQSAPSQILVTGFTTEVADVDVTLSGLTHSRTQYVDFLLVGPGGQSALILSDVGFFANDVTLRFRDQAVSQVLSASGSLRSGTYQPTNFSSASDTFSSPAPTLPQGSRLGVFNSTDPNGVWTLYAKNDGGGMPGALTGGWSLRITSANSVPNASPDSYQAQAGKTLSGDPSVLANDEDPDVDTLTAILAGKPRQGTVNLAPDGTFTYRPGKRAKGTDSFTYLAQDQSGLSDLETVTIQIAKAKKKKKGKK